MDIKRVFLVILDSYGIGAAKDAKDFGDEGSNTLKTIISSKEYNTPNMANIGLFNIDGIDFKDGVRRPIGSYGRLEEASMGKDTTIGHWEIAGIISDSPLPTYPNGFPDYILNEFKEKTGKNVICNKPYSGTEVIKDYGNEHIKTGDLIVYTSADSVFQIAAHEDIVPIEKLYEYCHIARDILKGKDGVGRVIARPFEGEYPFKRTPRRHDYSLLPPKDTMLDYLEKANLDTIGIGKIYDIFAGKGINETTSIVNNIDGMEKTIALQGKDFTGLAFVNLVDFDMVYGHRNDIEGYAKAATKFDNQLGEFINNMKDDDVLIITADHGCDPGFKGTDHSREDVPLLVYGKRIKENNSLGTRNSFADVAKTILDMFNVENNIDGISFLNDILV
ncbi:MAG: phosphopentomutase [Lachnospirales bacterium]